MPTEATGWLAVLAENAEDAALDGYLGGGDIDGVHFRVGRLEADQVALVEEALQGGF